MAVSPPPMLMQSPLFNHLCWGIHRIEQVQSRPHWPFSLYLCHSCVLQLLTTSFFKCCDLSLTPSLLLPGTGPSGFGCHTFSVSIDAVAAVLSTLGCTPLPAAAHLPQSFHPQSWGAELEDKSVVIDCPDPQASLWEMQRTSLFPWTS